MVLIRPNIQPGFPNMVLSHPEMLDTSVEALCSTWLSVSLKSSMSWTLLSLRTWSNVSLSAFADSSSEDIDILLEPITPDLILRYTRAYKADLSAMRSPAVEVERVRGEMCVLMEESLSVVVVVPFHLLHENGSRV